MKLRIAITADPEIPVPPRHYGGIERIVELLVAGLCDRGHDVTLFANSESQVPCRLAPWRGRSSRSMHDTTRNAFQLFSECRRNRFDVVHSFGRLAYLAPLLPLAVPKLMSYQRHITRRSVLWGDRLSRGSLRFAACSRHLLEGVADVGVWYVIYNAVSREKYHFAPAVSADAPLVFLGRMERIKGPHLALEAARLSGKRLILAGNVPPTPEHQQFFKDSIAPFLDGEQVRYIGPVDDRAKDSLLGSAAALLMPLLWNEPFGIVMAEALACGTPVIGFPRGSVPEIVQHGINGYICGGVEHMASLAQEAHRISRAACRSSFEERFSESVMVSAYLDAYHQALGAAA